MFSTQDGLRGWLQVWGQADGGPAPVTGYLKLNLHIFIIFLCIERGKSVTMQPDI